MTIIFSKLLSKTDINNRLSVPTKQLRSLPSFRGGHAVELQAVDDETGHTWTFTCNRRKNKHPKPALSRGWLGFVRSKRLKVGDKVNLYHMENPAAGGARFRIQAEKQVKIFGAIFGYAPIGNPAP